MKNKKRPDFNTQKIIDYYQSTKLDYQLYNLSFNNISLHFGLWDKKTHTPKQALLNENHFLLEFSGIKPKDHVLDMGCGYGATAVWLASKIACKVVGVTLGTEQVNAAQRFSRQKKVDHLTEFMNMDFHKMTFPDNFFDVIIALDSMCHSPNKISVLKECYRLLKPGGRIIVADSFFKKIKSSLLPSKHKMISTYLHTIQIPELLELDEFEGNIKKVGFKNIEWADKTNLVLPPLKKLNFLSPISSFLSSFFRFFGMNALGSKHTQAFINQYKSLEEGILAYGFWRAKKPY